MFLEQKQFFYKYDLDSASYKYGRLGDASGHWVQGKWGATTVGSTANIDSAVATKPAFGPIVAGDFIEFLSPPDTTYIRKVVTKTSNIAIVVSSAVNLGTTGMSFRFWPFRIGTAATDGWHYVSNSEHSSVFVNWATKAADAIDLSIEGLGANGVPFVITTKSYNATVVEEIPITAKCRAIRVGVKAAATFAGTDDLNIWLEQRSPRLVA